MVLINLIYDGGPKSNWTLNLARELEVVVRCAARCCGSTQYSCSLPLGVSRLTVVVAFFLNAC